MINKDLFQIIIFDHSIIALYAIRIYILIGTVIQLIITSRGFNSLLVTLYKKKLLYSHFDLGSFVNINNKDNLLLIDIGFSSRR